MLARKAKQNTVEELKLEFTLHHSEQSQRRQDRVDLGWILKVFDVALIVIGLGGAKNGSKKGRGIANR